MPPLPHPPTLVLFTLLLVQNRGGTDHPGDAHSLPPSPSPPPSPPPTPSPRPKDGGRPAPTGHAKHSTVHAEDAHHDGRTAQPRKRKRLAAPENSAPPAVSATLGDAAPLGRRTTRGKEDGHAAATAGKVGTVGTAAAAASGKERGQSKGSAHRPAADAACRGTSSQRRRGHGGAERGTGRPAAVDHAKPTVRARAGRVVHQTQRFDPTLASKAPQLATAARRAAQDGDAPSAAGGVASAARGAAKGADRGADRSADKDADTGAGWAATYLYVKTSKMPNVWAIAFYFVCLAARTPTPCGPSARGAE